MARRGTRTASAWGAVVGYCRVSTPGQATEGVSLEAQRTAIEAWASTQERDVLQVFTDAGLSGKRADNRPALQQALALATTHRAVVIVYKLDRLARSTRDALEIAERLSAAGADLVSLSEQIDTTTAYGRMFFTLAAAFAQLERDLTSERTAAALSHKRSKGERVGHVPYGYTVAGDGVRLLPVASEQSVLERMRRWRARGWSYGRIANQLDAADVPTRSGRSWHMYSVAVMLRRYARRDAA